MPVDPTPILVADDDENDVIFLRRAFERAGVMNPLFITRDGEEAIKYLAGTPPYDDRAQYPLPGLFLLDLKMPRINGFDVLTWVSQRSELKGLILVVLSSSDHEQDMRKARDLGVHEYMTKPSDFQNLVDLMLQLKQRWLKQPVSAA